MHTEYKYTNPSAFTALLARPRTFKYIM